MTTFHDVTAIQSLIWKLDFHLKYEDTELSPLCRSGALRAEHATETDERRCEEILAIQSMGLKKRLEHTHCKSSGGRYLRRTGFYPGASGYGKGF